MQDSTSKLEVLIAAMNIRSKEQLPIVARQALDQGCSALIINQTEIQPGLESPSENLRIFNYSESGISKSRNRALRHARGEILLITDEDVELLDGFSKTLTETFDKNPEADLITFQCLNEKGAKRKNYPDSAFWHDKRTIMRVSSVEIAMRRDTLVKNALFFDERFGIGSQISTGSETVFLSDALARGMKILYRPKAIVRHPDESSGRALRGNRELIRAKGGMFYRVFGWKAYGICLYFALKKRKEMGFSLVQNMKLMLSGIKQFKALDHGK
jgi:glycosyltransferase involved in cell wall biosynthesis